MALDNRTDAELRDEARRRGLDDADTMSRGDLLEALAPDEIGSNRKGPRSFLSRVVRRVRGALGSDPPPERSRQRQSDHGGSGLGGPRTSEEAEVASRGSTSGDPSSPRDEAADEAADHAPTQEPILTRTMAGLLAAQGHDERALAIYDTLLEGSEVDPSVVAEATAVRRRVAERRAGAPHAPVVAIPVRNGAYLIAWQLSEDAIARARGVLGEDGTLAVRVVLVRPDQSAVVAVEVLDRAADIAGEWLIDPLTAGSRLTAAVGVQSEDRFVSAAHTTAIVGG